MANSFNGRQNKAGVQIATQMKANKNGRITGMPNQKPKRIRKSQQQLEVEIEVDSGLAAMITLIILGIIAAVVLVVIL